MNKKKDDLEKIKGKLESVLNTAVEVIKTPSDFFKKMPKSGGLAEPLIFLVVLGIISGLIQIFLTVFSIGIAGSLFAAITRPIFAIIFGFVGAGVLFVIWKLMGSKENFEVAFRCAAFTTAITPITNVLNSIPYLGSLLGVAWMVYLLVLASQSVHKLETQKAWIVFGVIGCLLTVRAFNTQATIRKAERSMAEWERTSEDMSPEEAGRALGAFLKGLQEKAESQEE